MWTRSTDSAVTHLQLRQMQSAWYTKLFQASREPLEQPYNYIWRIYNEMSEWFAAIPHDTTDVLKQFFEMELLYSYVYILSPNSACPQPSEHAQRLVIEHCTKHARMVQSIQVIPPTEKKPSPFSFYDALRVYMMGRIFVDTLSSNLDALLLPAPHHASISSLISLEDMDPHSITPMAIAPPLPPLNSNEYHQNPAARAIETVETYLSILNALSIRFGVVSGISWHNKFQAEANPLLTQLRQRLHSQNTSPQDSSTSYFWATTGVGGPPLTPAAQTAVLGTSPGSHRSAAFYPSPPATQYSPAYAPDPQQTEMNNGGWYGGSELGIDHMAAWKTLPGGPMNPRFA